MFKDKKLENVTIYPCENGYKIECYTHNYKRDKTFVAQSLLEVYEIFKDKI